MGITLKKNKKVGTLTAQERAENASLDVANALAGFNDTLAVLDAAVVELQIASEEAHEEADRHRRIAESASLEAVRHANVAGKFRALVGA